MSSRVTQAEIEFSLQAADDPVFYMEEVLGLRLWSGQRRIARAIKKYNNVAIRSGHKTGKSTTLAGVSLWYPFATPDSRVAITSASFHQVQKVLWREITKLHSNAKMKMGGTIYRDPATGYQLPNGNEIFGFSTAEPERAAGISSPNLMYLIDEGSGVPPPVFEAIEGNRAAGAKLVMPSNPTKTSGVFFDAFHSKREFWHCIHIPSTESPNVTGEMHIPGLATHEWIEEKKKEWGEDSPMYQVRVLGNFPGQGTDAVIGLSLVVDARKRYKDAMRSGVRQDGALRIGVDVARYGDDETVIQPVRGQFAYPAFIFGGAMDGLQVAGKIMEVVDKFRRPTDAEVRVKVDEIGLGASPVDFLTYMDRAREQNVITVPVNVSRRADDEDSYYNLRSQMCFDLRDWLMEGGAVPEDESLTQEMVSPTYSFDAKGRRRLDPKDKEKKILGRSPDRRNALELAIYEAVAKRTIGGGFFPM